MRESDPMPGPDGFYGACLDVHWRPPREDGLLARARVIEGAIAKIRAEIRRIRALPRHDEALIAELEVEERRLQDDLDAVLDGE